MPYDCTLSRRALLCGRDLVDLVGNGGLGESKSHTISARGMLLRCCTANTVRATLHKPVWRVAAQGGPWG